MSLLSHALSVYTSGLSIGFRTALRHPKIGLKQLFAPVGYWRVWPNAVVTSVAQKHKAKRILDVSSPKLPSLILGRKAEIWATDLDDPQLTSRWKITADSIGLERYSVRYEDASALSFPDNSFDLVYSISVIEHIPGDGDMRALAEFARVLEPGGSIIVEVPYRRKYEEVLQHYDSKGAPLPSPRFYERYYDKEALRNRLQSQALTHGLTMEQQWILGERLAIDPWIATPRLPRLLRLAILPLEPALAFLNYWMRTDDTQGRPLAALLVFRKAAR